MSKKIHDIDPVLVEVPMPIVTPRLILCPPMAGDGEILYETKSASWAELTKWMPWAEKPEEHSAEKDEILCRTQYAKFLLREDLMLFAFERESGKLVASSGLHRMNWRARIFEIGYWVRSDETGKGIASEVTNALVRYVFSALAANRVVIEHDTENAASCRVIEKLGFIKEGETQNSDIRGDRLTGTCSYARFDTDGLPDLEVRWGAEVVP